MEVIKKKKGRYKVCDRQSSVQNTRTRYREGRYNWKLAVGFPVSFSRRTPRIFHPLSRMFTLSWLRNARNDIFSNEAFSRKEISFAGNIDGNIFPSRRPTAGAFAKFFPLPTPPFFSFLLAETRRADENDNSTICRKLRLAFDQVVVKTRMVRVRREINSIPELKNTQICVKVKFNYSNNSIQNYYHFSTSV